MINCILCLLPIALLFLSFKGIKKMENKVIFRNIFPYLCVNANKSYHKENLD